MRKKLLCTLLLFICSIHLLKAQPAKDYHLYLQSGTVLPAENAASATKDDAVFTTNLFGGKYYVVIQFYELPDEFKKTLLKTAGVELLQYLPRYAYTAAVSKDVNLEQIKTMGIRSFTALTAAQKSSSEINKRNIPSHAVKQSGWVDVTILTFEKMSTGTLLPYVQLLNGTIISSAEAFQSYTIRIPQTNYLQLSQLPIVQWMEFAPPPNELENLPGRTLHRVNVLQEGSRNLLGDGINIGIWDGGPLVSHLDFLPAGRVVNVQTGTAIQHASHVAGTIGGKGIINPVARGMAPNANMFSWDFNGDIQSEMAAGIPANNLVITSHSYGFSFSGACDITNSLLAYNSIARNTDLNINNFPQHLHVHSAGNSQGSCAGVGGYFTITGSGKPAKNNLVVANISSAENLSSSSSVGPVHDGRIKPEISGMGSSVFSISTPANTYATLSGTSMATPGISGTAALLYQRYKQLNANNNPPSALIKNVICNTAKDLGNAGPDYKFGFGRIDGLLAVRTLEENRYVVNNVAPLGNREFTINAPAGTSRLKVMITWNDPAAASNSAIALVNNLDLMVFKGTDTTRPWILDKDNPSNTATRGKDNINNIEQVTIDNPSGTYTVRVEAIDIPVGASQEYFVSWQLEGTGIEVTYPNGNEKLSPGTSETITWNSSGITGTQTVEYSLDNGANWVVLNNVLGATTNRLTWTVPSGANTTTALIRVSSGAVSDVSDANFTIFGTVTGLAAGTNCNQGQLTLNWTAVANATAYDVLRLNETTAQWETIAANVGTNTHTITGLTPLSGAWYAVAAKNSTSGAGGFRSNAINATVSIAGITPGSITGNNSVCEGSTSVTYSIAAVTGATGYTWTVPTGAVIEFGQGSTSVTVSYPDGTVSGDVTVRANDSRGCSSNTVTRAVTVNPKPTKPVINWNGTILSTGSGLASYKWYLNNVLISGATTNSYTPTASGLYKVEITNSNNCVNISDEFNLTLTSLNEVSIEGSKVSVFPNPVKDVLNFNVTQQNLRRMEVSILTVDGRVMKQAVLPNGNSKMSLEQLPTGTYLVKIQQGNETRTIKVQVIR